jgi:G:T-mismatch repair DNA endonuclease (very short patch repair protein)
LLNGKIFDIFIPTINLLIEYNGDYWHCNPNKYLSDYFNHKKNKTAKEIWEYDLNKLYLAKNNGYNCLVIWESDYKKNKNIILKLIKDYGEHKQNDPS